MLTMSTITIEVPDSAVGPEDSRQAVAADVTMAVAVRLYMTGHLSLFQAAHMVGITKIDFRQRMGEYGGTEFTQSREELAQELIGA
jgi:predicted HTH domain antitoxin